MYRIKICCFLYTLVLLSSCGDSSTLHKDCFVVSDFASNKVLYQIGDCEIEESPCSTFKMALSVMGFDAGILKSDTDPEFGYKEDYAAPFDIWKQAHNPTSWIKNSCVWYSRRMTELLGFEKFKKYVNDFNYGNCDVSGDLGEHNGLTKSWLCSSLKISPLQQVEFIKKLLAFEFPVSRHAHVLTQKLLFLGDLQNGWKLYGKTGAGTYMGNNRSVGWFVGWVAKEQKKLLFACLIKKDTSEFVVNNGKLAKEKAMHLLKQYGLIA